jgi:hypothetical protein
MPFALITIGLLLVVTGFGNTYSEFSKQLEGDFTGKNNFLYWIVAIVAIGALGYVKELEPFSRMFLALIVVAIFLSNSKSGNDFFSKFNQGIAQATGNNSLSVVKSNS